MGLDETSTKCRPKLKYVKIKPERINKNNFSEHCKQLLCKYRRKTSNVGKQSKDDCISLILLSLPNSENNRLGRKHGEESKQMRIPKTADALAGKVELA